MLYVGLDLSRKRLDFHAADRDGEPIAVGAAPPDTDGLRHLVKRLGDAEEVVAVIETMNGARFVHDQLELQGWDVRVADAWKARALAPLACKTDRIDAWVLAELARRDLVPEVWLPDPTVRAERERARFRLHLVRHRSALKNRIHASLIAFGHPCPVSDLFGVGGRQLLGRLALPEAWRETLETSLYLVDELDEEIQECERELKRLGADHRYVPLLTTIPGIAWTLGYTNRGRDRRHQPLPQPGQADRLHRPLPACLSVRGVRPAWAAAQERAALPALGADRGRPARRPQPRLPLPRGLRANARSHRP